MPLWHIYAPADKYTAADKRAFAVRVAELYVDVTKMPKFYVNVIFHDLDADSFYIGGEPRSNFVRISIDHIARKVSAEHRQWWMRQVDQAIAPWVADRGLDWEIHIDETPRDLWTVQGFVPPQTGSEDEMRWCDENRPSQPTTKSAPDSSGT
jgi:phenylpyruvate tautomerase PptA (4-oxalocrotonate tautomerase family)